MDFTLQIFVPESNLSADPKAREKLEMRFPVRKGGEGSNLPVLMQIVQGVQQTSMTSPLKDVSPAPPEPRSGEQTQTESTVIKPEFAVTKYGGFPMDEAVPYVKKS